MYMHVRTCTTYLSLVIGELRLHTKATLEHLKWEDLIFLVKRTNTGCGHFLSIAMVQEINLDLETERERENERHRERDKGLYIPLT